MTFADFFLYSTLIAMALLAVDDLLLDLLSILYRAWPQKIHDSFDRKIKDQSCNHIAIMIANWKEEDVIEAMITGNLARIQYQDYQFFLGVYPNDTPTLEKALELERRYSQVKAVINPRNGPTSKGQMLNVCVQQILDYERNHNRLFDVFLMHDSEDVIHPHSLRLINWALRDAGFIQLPVYSFDLPKSEWVGATYLDEFSEHHSKEMILRSKLNVAVPSAGTGTAMARSLVLRLLQEQDGKVLKENTLTEDYHLGYTAHRLGFRTRFLCCYFENKKGRDFIATREYFPKRWRASLRQKTRWNIGILFQGAQNLRWEGSALERYFLWRDRRSLINTYLVVNSVALFLLVLPRTWGWPSPFTIEEQNLFHGLITFNFINVFWRMLVRMKAVAFVNHPTQALLVPIRWWVANFINTGACLKAWQDFRIAERKGESPKWVKTQHELPVGFGVLELKSEGEKR